MTRALVVIAVALTAVGVVALALAFIGGTVVETFVVNGHTTTTTHHHFGSFMPTILAFALAAVIGFAALLSRILPN